VDLDQDGRSDLISGSWPGELYFFRRQADGKFAAPEQLIGHDGKPINPGNGASVFAVDWDANGTLDLLVGNMLGDVNWFSGKRADGKMTFGPPQPVMAAGENLKSPSGEAAPVAADWDGDGKLDLVLGTENGSVFWYRNGGPAGIPKLEAARTLVGESPVAWKGDENRIRGEWGLRVKPCVVDWNGDGKLDLLLGDRCGAFTAKASQTAGEKEEERRANDRLPALRRTWATAFQEYSKLQTATAPQDETLRKRSDELRGQMVKLKSEIVRVQETQIHYQPGYQSHGFVWIFLRKVPNPLSDKP
jgi:FG-GAP-like repeat